MTDERIILQKQEKDVLRKVGRPSINPFHRKEVEEDFYCRAQYVVGHYFSSSKEFEKKPFVLNERCHMGKTTFWAFIFYFYKKTEQEWMERKYCPVFPETERPWVDDNLSHFLMLLAQKVGSEAVGNRASTLKVVDKLESMEISAMFVSGYDKSLSKESTKYREIYQLVLEIWYNIPVPKSTGINV